MMKIGVGITTFNKQDYYKQLYDSLPYSKIDHLITTNMGDKYEDNYSESEWNQWTQEDDLGPAHGRNQNIEYLYDKGCDYIFLIEDDMVIKSPDVFDTYIDYSINTGIKYFIYCSTTDGAGIPGNRTPRLKVKYPDDRGVWLYPNMNNDFVCHHRSNFDERKYDTSYRYIFDIELTYYHTFEKQITSPFWWFADIENSDKYVNNQPESTSRINEQREKKLLDEFTRLQKQYGYWVNNIPQKSRQEVIDRLKQLKP